MELHYFSSGPRENVLSAMISTGHRVLSVNVTDPEKWPKVLKTVEVAERHDIPVRIVTKKELPELGRELGRYVYFSAGFAYLFPKELIGSSAVCLNVHCTLLPDYRGARTLNWIVENNEPYSGITVHKIDNGMDTGDILLQRKIPVSRFDTGKSLYRRSLEAEPSVVLEALALLAAGAGFTPQLKSGAKEFPNRVPEDSRLDPSLPLLSLFDKIRAADPKDYPAHFYVDGQKVCIQLWRETKPPEEFDFI